MSNKQSSYSETLNARSYDIKMSKLDSDLHLIKESYPNSSDGIAVPGQYNIDQWVESLKEVYSKVRSGLPWKQALDETTSDWNDAKKFDFSNWIKFYQSGGHRAYGVKVANTFYENPDEPGYFIPNAMYSDVNHSSDDNEPNDISYAKQQELDLAEKKKLVEKQRKKIISRLDSVEKLLRSDEGHLLTEAEFESLMESIYSLKKKISTLKKKSSSESFYKDLIVREANILINKGFVKAPAFLYVAADDHADSNEIDAGPPPAQAPAATQTGGSTGLPGAVPAVTGPAAGGEPEAAGIVAPSANNPPMPADPSGSKTIDPAANSTIGNNQTVDLSPMDEFVNSMNIGDVGAAEDDLLVYDEEEPLIVEAQEEPPAPTPIAPPAAEETPIEVTEPAEPIINPEAAPATTSQVQFTFDNELESLLTKITIADVVKKLEEIAKIFKTREIPRQLSIIDMMLDKLGLSSFFPTLSEATNKALESNNYILSRIEGIQAQLTGAMGTKEIDLTNKTPISNPEVDQVRSNLQQQEEADKERKEMRKELADKALAERGKETTPDIEVTEEELPAPAPVAPPAAPAVAPPPTT